MASRPARLCRRAYRNIQPQDSRYDRGTAGGQVTCLEFLKAGDTLVVWKLDRLGRSLTNLLAIITDLKNRGVAFRSLTEQMDTSTPHGELLFSLFGALTRERVMAGLVAARRRGRRGGRPPSIDAETIEQITAALDAGASKASVCRSFKVPRSTLIGTLDRIGWTGPVKA
ncbi:recombinase family protein [Sphingobium yanoikuyae]|uniref:recombinase family protein n=1 Tax=Sphingobium yanoikuyae TaxID=13690 RepID=UPI003F02D5BB